MLLFAQGLFRLDVTLRGDTMRIIVRNLSSGELEIESSLGDYEGGASPWVMFPPIGRGVRVWRSPSARATIACR